MRLNRFFMVCAVFVVFLLISLVMRMPLHERRPGVTPANFRRLHIGMTEKEVEAILGHPGDDGMRFTGNHYTNWFGEDCDVSIRFNDYRDTPDAMKGVMSLNDGTKLEFRQKSTIGFIRNLFGM